MMPFDHLELAVIGDKDLVNGLRLAGVSRCYPVREHDIREDVRKTLSALLDEPEVGMVVIPEEYVNHVEDLLAQAREGKKMTPIIIEIPSRRGMEYEAVREYYKAFIRKFIGFALEM